MGAVPVSGRKLKGRIGADCGLTALESKTPKADVRQQIDRRGSPISGVQTNWKLESGRSVIA